MRKTNLAGIKLIKEFEGCALQAYPDPATKGDPWTIGYGHTRNVHKGMKISQEQAESMLMDDLIKFEAVVAECVKVVITDNQFAALVSFTFNCGDKNFKGSTLLKKLNDGVLMAAADELLKWTRAAGKRMPGLIRRRKAERDLFLSNYAGDGNEKNREANTSSDADLQQGKIHS